MDGQTGAMSKIAYFCYYTSMQCTYCVAHWFQHRKYFLKSRTVVLHLLEAMMVFWLPQRWQRQWFITHKSNAHHNVTAQLKCAAIAKSTSTSMLTWLYPFPYVTNMVFAKCEVSIDPQSIFGPWPFGTVAISHCLFKYFLVWMHFILLCNQTI